MVSRRARCASLTLDVRERRERVSLRDNRIATSLLRSAVVLWYVVTVLGQLLFALYITVLYGGGAFRGDITVLNAVMPTGYVPGDTVGNATIFVHLALAVFIIASGALQLIPAVRRHAPWLHRRVGRTYIVAALLISVGGLYLVWVRGAVGDVTQHLASTLNASLIVSCGIIAWRAARARSFDRHRRWALRLFLSASGVWFFRVGLMLWLLIFRRPVGFDVNTFEGPFLSTLAFAESIVPLAILQLYFWAQETTRARARVMFASLLVVLTCGIAVGILSATMGMWLPKMR